MSGESKRRYPADAARGTGHQDHPAFQQIRFRFVVSQIGHYKALTAEDAEDAEEKQIEGKQNWNLRRGD
jgi:hypothetical protein